MDSRETRTFQQLFKEQKYLTFKNYLYNYLLRKRAVEKCLKHDRSGWMLEVGSGISPLITDTDNIIAQSVTFNGVIKQKRGRGLLVME